MILTKSVEIITYIISYLPELHLVAVRHGGFKFPWDDDIDVILMRDEYERFFWEAAGDFDPSVYYVQRDNSPHWPMQFSKLRRNGTACIEKYHPRQISTPRRLY